MGRRGALTGPTTRRVLTYVREHGPVDQPAARRIADALGMNVHTVTDHLARLDAAGLIHWRRVAALADSSSAGGGSYTEGAADAVVALFRAGFLRNAEPRTVSRVVGVAPSDLVAAAQRMRETA